MDLVDLDSKTFDEPWTSLRWKTFSRAHAVLVATISGEFAGFIAVEQAEIMKLAVRPKFRRQGLARQLIEKIDTSYLYLILPEHQLNTPASAFLKSLGFEAQVPLLKDHFNYYGEPEHGVRFRLERVAATDAAFAQGNGTLGGGQADTPGADFDL